MPWSWCSSPLRSASVRASFACACFVCCSFCSVSTSLVLRLEICVFCLPICFSSTLPILSFILAISAVSRSRSVMFCAFCSSSALRSFCACTSNCIARSRLSCSSSRSSSVRRISSTTFFDSRWITSIWPPASSASFEPCAMRNVHSSGANSASVGRRSSDGSGATVASSAVSARAAPRSRPRPAQHVLLRPPVVLLVGVGQPRRPASAGGGGGHLGDGRGRDAIARGRGRDALPRRALGDLDHARFEVRQILLRARERESRVAGSRAVCGAPSGGRAETIVSRFRERARARETHLEERPARRERIRGALRGLLRAAHRHEALLRVAEDLLLDRDDVIQVRAADSSSRTFVA